MSKVTITVEEKVIYIEEITVEQPETMEDEQFEEILGRVEGNCRYDGSSGDIAYLLENRFGLKVLDLTRQFPESPHGHELEIIDVRNVKETNQKGD
jgi:hypothetical protein